MRDLTYRSRGLLLMTILTAMAVAYDLTRTDGISVMAIQTTNAQSSSQAHATTNPLLAKWEGPYGGVPPFDRVQVAQFKPALEAGMAENLAEVDRIAKDPAAPTFDNTITALERAGQTLDRVQTIYGVFRFDHERARVSGSTARDGAAPCRLQRSDHSERSTLQAHRDGLQLCLKKPG